MPSVATRRWDTKAPSTLKRNTPGRWPIEQPHTCPPQGVHSSVGAKMIRQIAPRCPGSQDPEDAVEDTSVVYPRNATRLVRQHRLDGKPFIVGEFAAHDSTPSLGV